MPAASLFMNVPLAVRSVALSPILARLEARPQGTGIAANWSPPADAQLEQLRGAGCSKIYREKVTGAHSDRRELLKMLHALAPGDMVTVTRIDRLARSTFDLFAIVTQIVDAQAQFRSLAEPWADTGTSTGRLMIAVLGGLADVARPYPHPDSRGQKPRQGPRAADGPTPALTPEQQKEATRRRAQGATLDELARSYNVGISTIRRVTRAALWPAGRRGLLKHGPL
jgi:DNA invertase Pin-like site-specific DNA recombinase